MSNLIAVLCVSDSDFVEFVNEDSDIFGLVNGRAVTNDGDTLVAVSDTRHTRGLNFKAYQMTPEFEKVCKTRIGFELLTNVKLRVR